MKMKKVNFVPKFCDTNRKIFYGKNKWNNPKWPMGTTLINEKGIFYVNVEKNICGLDEKKYKCYLANINREQTCDFFSPFWLRLGHENAYF